MADVQLRFAKGNGIVVSGDDADELARRLEAMPGGQRAADELRAHRRFADDDQKSRASRGG